MLLAFLSAFHLVGGVVAGKSLRQGIRHGWSCNLLGGLFWGVFFGGLPLIFGVAEFVGMGVAYPVLIEFLVFAGALLVVTLTPDWILETFDFQVFAPILFGGAFMVIGAVLFLNLVGENLVAALFALAAFGGSGAFVFVARPSSR